MQDQLIQALDAATRISVTVADCTSAAACLARAHLSGPAAATALSHALAAVALLGVEASQDDETVVFRLDCPGPLGGFLVESTARGTLRGYTKVKVLDDFDGMGTPRPVDLYGASGTFSVLRSIPGAIVASGSVAIDRPTVAAGLAAYFTQSLQRRVKVASAAVVPDEGAPTFARAILVECPPDGDAEAFAAVKTPKDLAVSPRNLLSKLGLPHAEIRRTVPLAFACRCSRERAAETLSALTAAERAELPPTLSITCHMCGRTWTVPTTSA